jgi:hypothetical protein
MNSAMTDKQKLHERLAHLHLNRVNPNHGRNPEIEKRNERNLKLARWHVRRAGGE